MKHLYALSDVYIPSPFALMSARLPIGIPQLSIEHNLKLLDLLHPKFVYISSHLGIEKDLKVVNLIQEWLSKAFPEKAPWEKW